jgi:cytidyltransferase-like protein
MNVTHIRLIEDWSQEILLEYFKATGKPLELPVPIFDIAEKLFTLKCDIENIKEGKLGEFSAISIPAKNWILLNNNQNIRRMRYSLAHEIVHWFVEEYSLRHTSHGDWTFGYLRTNDANVREKLAEYFAEAILMPKGLVLHYSKKLNCFNEKEIQQLADIFFVSRTAMSIRLENIYKQPIIHEKLDEEVIFAFNLEKSSRITSKHRFSIVKPPKLVFDNRFVRYLRQTSEEGNSVYFWLDQKKPQNIDALMGLKYGDGFIIGNGDFKQLGNFFSELGEVIFSDFTSHDIYYERTYEKSLENNNRVTDEFAYPRLSSHITSGTQLKLIQVGNYIEPKHTLNKRTDARKFIKSCQIEGKEVVIATGCFDLVTDAHVRFLEQAKSNGDVLVVGIEDDIRVRAFKGPSRPVNTQSQRMEVLEALKFVDLVFVIHGSPNQEVKPFYTRLHKFLGADILAVTEGDPHVDDRRDEIQAAGGHLIMISIYPQDGKTTHILRKFLKETIISDIVFLKKRKLYEWKNEKDGQEKQLVLPFPNE